MSWSKLARQGHLPRPLILTCSASMSMFRSKETRQRRIKYEKMNRNRIDVIDPEEERKLPSKSRPMKNFFSHLILLDPLLRSLPVRLRESANTRVHVGHGLLRGARCPRAPPAEAEKEGTAAGDAPAGEVRVCRDGAREGRGLRLRLHVVRAGRQGKPHHGHRNK